MRQIILSLSILVVGLDLAFGGTPGDLDPRFGQNGKVVTAVPGVDEPQAIAIQRVGKIVLAGFSSDGFTLVRYLKDGKVDASFGANGRVTTSFGGDFDRAQGIATQADGKIVVAGNSCIAVARPRTPFEVCDFALARYLADGNLDTSFGNGGKVITDISPIEQDFDRAYALLLRPDGRITVAGSSFEGLTGSDFAVVTYLPDGNLDTTFGGSGKVTTDTGAPEFAYALALDRDGAIVVGGSRNSNSDPSSFSFMLARYLPSGSLDQAFGEGGVVTTSFGDARSVVYDLAIRDGKAIAAGTIGDSVGIVRYLRDGTPDPRFGRGGQVITDIFSQQGPGKLLAIQQEGGILVSDGFGINRLFHDGTLDHRFGIAGRATAGIPIAGLQVQRDGNIVVGGSTRNSDTATDFSVARFLGRNTIRAAPLPRIRSGR